MTRADNCTKNRGKCLVELCLSMIIIIHSVQVICVDPDQLIQTKIAESGLDIHQAMVKVGLDGGQGMLKVAATVEEQKKDLEPGKKRTSYKNLSKI